MTSLISLNGVHPNLVFRLEDDNNHVLDRCDDQDFAVNDGLDDQELAEMQDEDEEYLEQMERQRVFEHEEVMSLRSTGLVGTSIDVEVVNDTEANNIDETSERPLQSSTKANLLKRFRQSLVNDAEKMTYIIVDSWDKRHDRNHRGFWYETWHWLIGSKEEANAPREGDPDYVPPKYRWTPILSGLLQPFSILLEIPGLTEHWYVRTVDNVPVVYQPNPAILDVGLALSMACGVVANVALISRFLERRVLTSTIVTIVGLSLHDLINVIAVTIFGVIHRVDDGFTYSEAFWLCVCSTVASMFTNITLIYDLIKTKDFGRSGSGLTPKQRSLVIIVMILLVYIAIGALCLNFLLPEIPFQNVMYFTIVSIETIGFGDILPTTQGSKIFLFFYIPFGILSLAVTVGTARDALVESWHTTYRRRRHEMLRRHRIRKQQRIEEAAHRAAIERQLAAAGAMLYVQTHAGGRGARKQELNIQALTAGQLQAAENEAINELASKQGSNGDAGQALDEAMREEEALTSQTLLSEESYREFQGRIAREEKMENYFKALFAASLFLVFWLVGAAVFSKTEGWGYFTGFYFCFIAFTTIGYGDVAPQSPAGRAFFIIWAIFGVATVTLLIAVLTEFYASHYKTALVQKRTRQAIAALKEHRDVRAEEVAPEKLPYEVVNLIKEWHHHVSAARQGNDSDGMRAIVARLIEEQGLSEQQRKELLSDSESRSLMFWNGYDRAVQTLLAVAESSLKQHEVQAREIKVLRQLSFNVQTTDTIASISSRIPIKRENTVSSLSRAYSR